MLACSQYTPSLISSLLCCTVLLCLPCHLYHALYALCSFMEHVFSTVNSNESTTKFTIALLDSRGFVQLATLLQFIPLPFEHLQQHVANHETFRDIAFSTKYLGRYTLMKLMKESQFINVLLTVIFVQRKNIFTRSEFCVVWQYFASQHCALFPYVFQYPNPPKWTGPKIRPKHVKLVVDAMLQGLGRQLRCCGVDVRILTNDRYHHDAIKVSK